MTCCHRTSPSAASPRVAALLSAVAPGSPSSFCSDATLVECVMPTIELDGLPVIDAAESEADYGRGQRR